MGIAAPVLAGSAAPARALDRLPLAGLLALAMTGFVAIMTETLPAGLLPQIGKGLGVSESLAGQLITLYAAGSLAASLPLTAATQGWPRRRVLLLSIVGFLAFNTVTALSASYALTLGARFLAGVAAGLSWGIIGGYARRMVTGSLQGRAMAIAMVGTPVALSLGTPAGAFLGGLFGWRLVFAAMSLLAAGLIGWVFWKVPDFPGQGADGRATVAGVFAMPGIRPVLLVVFAWMFAHNVLYTYIAPFLALAGLGDRADLVLLLFGVAALAGIWGTSFLVERQLRASVLVSLATFALVAVALIAGGRMPIVVLPAVAVWGMTFGGAATLLQTASADAAGGGVDISQAMVTTAWNAAIAGGGIIGGLLLAGFGAGSFAWAMLVALLLALATAWRAKASGFPPGPRGSPP